MDARNVLAICSELKITKAVINMTVLVLANVSLLAKTAIVVWYAFKARKI